MEGSTRRLVVVLPARNEQDSLAPLLERLLNTLPQGSAVLIVDDSTGAGVDASRTVVNRCSSSFGDRLQIVFEHRDQSTGGLSGAVIHGIKLATTMGATHVVVMDADGQHPAEVIPGMLRLSDDYDFGLVVGSRYCPGGTAEGLDGPLRVLVSRASTVVAKALFPTALRGVTDPMTGFFMVRVKDLVMDRLASNGGFKILLDLLVTHDMRRGEVPIVFASREAGDSKGTIRVGLIYLRQLFKLRRQAYGRRPSAMPI